MISKVTFNKAGSGSTSARMIIPKAYVELLKLTKEENMIDITYDNGKIIITKATKRLD